MNEPLALEDITGLTLTMIGVLVENYIKEGYADPTMYRALRAAGELAEQYKARIEYDNGETELVEAIGELVTNLQVTAMECGEVVNKIIEEHGFPIDKGEW
jgi:hypothetical protein